MKQYYKANDTILLEKNYDEKKYSVRGIFKSDEPEHYSDGTFDRASYKLNEKEAGRLNENIETYDGHVVINATVVPTKTGLRIYPH